MAFRIIFLLLCIVVFINGCNNLMSQHFGTHKLRTLSMDDLGENSVGDADFIAISDAQMVGDFIFAPGRGESDRAVVLYPLLGNTQVDSIQRGLSVSNYVIGWEHRRRISDVDTVGLLQRDLDISGLVRKPAKRYLKAIHLESAKYNRGEAVPFVQVGTEPLAWYWNVGALLLSFTVFLLLARKLK